MFEAPKELAPVPGLEELSKGRFIRPFVSLVPVTSFRLSRAGRPVPGEGFSIRGGGVIGGGIKRAISHAP